MLKSLIALSLLSWPFYSHAAELKDGQIAEVLVKLNQGEVEAAKLAEKKVQSTQVKEFAMMMNRHHTQNEKDVKALASKTNIGTDSSDLSKLTEKEAKASYKQIETNKGTQFDNAYVTAQIAMHEKALATIEGTLIPAAKNEELKALLVKTQATVAQHLEQAKTLKQ